MTPEQERENAIRGMKYVASDTASIRRSKRAVRDEYVRHVTKYCRCGVILGEDQPIGAKCWRCADTIALEKKKVEREDNDTGHLTCFVIGVVFGVGLLLFVQKMSG